MTETQPEKSGSVFDVKWNDTNELPMVANYRKISVPGVLAFLFGLVSPLVLINWGFVFLPLVAAVLAFLALYQISQSDGMVFGRPFAWIAIFLSFCIVVGNYSCWEAYKGRIFREAMDFSDSYFELINRVKSETGKIDFNNIDSSEFKNKHYDPEVDILSIKDMRSPYWQRSHEPLKDRWIAVAKSDMAQEDVGPFSQNPTLRILLELGDKAKITFYKVKSFTRDKMNSADLVTLIYAVTYKNDNEKPETFFVELSLKRWQERDSNTVAVNKTSLAGWSVDALKGPVPHNELKAFGIKGDF